MTLNLVYSSSWFIDGLFSFVRGASQIISTPLTWCLRIPLKIMITAVADEEQYLAWEQFILNEDEESCPMQHFVRGTELNLKSKNIPIESIMKFLEKHPEITSLDMSYNHIGDLGAQALAANTTLTSLNVRSNHIGELVPKLLLPIPH